MTDARLAEILVELAMTEENLATHAKQRALDYLKSEGYDSPYKDVYGVTENEVVIRGLLARVETLERALNDTVSRMDDYVPSNEDMCAISNWADELRSALKGGA